MAARRLTTTAIAVHYSPSIDDTFESIKRSHRKKGMLDIGFHYVISQNGRIEDGRPEDVCGNHCERLNDTSIAVCLIGPPALTSHGQDDALTRLIKRIQAEYPYAEVFHVTD